MENFETFVQTVERMVMSTGHETLSIASANNYELTVDDVTKKLLTGLRSLEYAFYTRDYELAKMCLSQFDSNVLVLNEFLLKVEESLNQK